MTRRFRPGTAPGPVSRLSFREDRYDTVLLNGKPLSELWNSDDENDDGGPYLSLDPHDRYYRFPVLEQLKSFESWTPIVVSNCNSSLGFGSTVFLVWVTESGNQATWSRFVSDSRG